MMSNCTTPRHQPLRMLQRSLSFVLAVLLLLPTVAAATQSSAAALDSPCPENMSQLDCDAIVMGWPNWVPDGVGCSSTTGAVGSTISQNIPNDPPANYRDRLAAAAAKHNADPNLLAAVFYWENRSFPSPDKTWATSSAGAQGPMQFISSTWAAYRENPSSNINDLDDAFWAAANYLAKNGGTAGTPLGTLEQPLAPGTLLRVAAVYNMGGGNVEKAGDAATLASINKETREYLQAVFLLISSDFTLSVTSPSRPQPVDTSSAGATASTRTNIDCTPSGEIGTGTGSFTTNTSIQFPGVEEMLRTTQAVADLNGETFRQICTNNPLGHTNCKSLCDYLAANVWGHRSSGYASAAVHWQAMLDSGQAHPGDRNPPVGASLFYNNAGPYGHIATYLGNNMVLSNDVGDRQSGVTGGAYIVPASDMEETGWHLGYLGWAPPIFRG